MSILKFTVTSLAFLASTLGGCATDQTTAGDKAALGAFTAEIGLCNAQPDPVACKQAVKAQFDAARKAQFDGGYIAWIFHHTKR